MSLSDHLTYIFSSFHFLRPLWLLALPFIALLWYLVCRRNVREFRAPDQMAPHLVEALTVGTRGKAKWRPIDFAGLGLCFLCLAAAGPTWSLMQNPLLRDKAPLVMVVRMANSLNRTDLAPSRLQRLLQKTEDLSANRLGAKTALVVYAGTAHQVAPLTEDPRILKSFLQSLSPEIMPREGSDIEAALDMAQAVLAKEKTAGSIILFVDELSLTEQAVVAQSAAEQSIVVWQFATLSQVDVIDLPRSVPVVQVTATDHDLNAVTSAVKIAFNQALASSGQENWKDQGPLLAIPAMILLLLTFRRGWTTRFFVVPVLLVMLMAPDAAHAEGWKDWFLTPDQQGAIAFKNKEYDQAAKTFNDPMWRALSLSRLGKYTQAAEVYSGLPSTNAAVGEGIALLKSRQYRPAITAFAKALEREPDNAVAMHNLALAKAILEFVENARVAADTGEHTGVGADATVFDNKKALGSDTQIQNEQDGLHVNSVDQWMRTIQTNTADFLRNRFAQEATEQRQ